MKVDKDGKTYRISLRQVGSREIVDDYLTRFRYSIVADDDGGGQGDDGEAGDGEDDEGRKVPLAQRRQSPPPIQGAGLSRTYRRILLIRYSR